MPLRYKIPGYVGNVALLVIATIVAVASNLIAGILLGALALLNLYLVYKLDAISEQQGWLEHELKITKLKEELLAAQKRVATLEGEVPHDAAPQPLSGGSTPH